MCRTYVYASLLSVMLAMPALAAPLQLAANNFSPFTDQTLPHNGLASDLVSSALSRAGFASEYHEEPWARALQNLQRDKRDIIIAAWYSVERESYGQFSEPYLINTVRFIRKKGAPIDYQQLHDLRPYLIVVIRGYAYAPAFDSDSSLHKHPVNSFVSAARMVAQGHAQLTVEDELVAQHAFNGELSDVREQLEFLPKPLSESPLHILVRRSHPQHQQIIDGFNAAMRDMRADGTYQQIVQRHAKD
jgi:polar amino acid transport system substrate-binding protein